MNNVPDVFVPILDAICPPPPRVTMTVPCPSCHGFGYREIGSIRDDQTYTTIPCTRCNASGWVEVDRSTQPRRTA